MIAAPKRYFVELEGAGVHWFRTVELATAFAQRMASLGFDGVVVRASVL
ncbi:hypothetical protein [Variovorax saccharolyticus]|nr:hypothetical protein [Variovorax sp. J31P216]MDM0027775.1 hypothetical protein [Variovorax sp. J31P216]